LQKGRLSLAYFRHATRDFLRYCFAAGHRRHLIANAKTSVTVRVTQSTLPEVRPALIGTGPDSLINRIDSR